MTESEKLYCVGCGELFNKEELEHVGLVLLCSACKQEAEDIQAMQSITNGGCQGYQ